MGNIFLVLFGAEHLPLSLALFFTIGSASGGYMVVNMVLLVEALHSAKARLLAIGFNGWPAGMVRCFLTKLFLLPLNKYYQLITSARRGSGKSGSCGSKCGKKWKSSRDKCFKMYSTFQKFGHYLLPNVTQINETLSIPISFIN